MARTVPYGKRRSNVAVSSRELEVLRLMASGYTVPEVAEKLFITFNTARSHFSNIYLKLGAKNAAHAVAAAFIIGVLTEDDVQEGVVTFADLKETEQKRKKGEEPPVRPSGSLATALSDKQRKSRSAFIELNGVFRAELTKFSLDITKPDADGLVGMQIVGSLPRVYQDLTHNLGAAVLTGVSLPDDRQCPFGQKVYVQVLGSSFALRNGGYRLRIRWRGYDPRSNR